MTHTLSRHLVTFLAAVAAVFAMAAPAYAAKDEIYTKRDNLGARGYDVVAYFTAGEPTKGSADFETTYKGATWRFSSQENLDRFTANPGQYAPQYGGYCAWALAKNQLAPGNPKFWKIVDGKLYLNYSKGVQKKWEKDISRLHHQC